MNDKTRQSSVHPLIRAVEDYLTGLARIDREFDAAKMPMAEALVQRYESRKSNWRTQFDQVWKKACEQADRLAARRDRHQRAFADLDLDTLPAAGTIPASLAVGTQQLSFEQQTYDAPRLMDFPLRRALWEDKNAQQKTAPDVLLRLVCALPPGRLELTLIDPLQQGQSAKPFLSLLKVKQLVPQQRVLTRSDDIEHALSALTDDVENLIQQQLSDREPDWAAYNAAHADNPLPYKVVLLFDVPEQMTDKSIWYLERLCENGPRCGVVPIMIIDQQRLDDRRHSRFLATVQASAQALHQPFADSAPEPLSSRYVPEQWPRQEQLERYFLSLAAHYAATSRFSKSLPDLWASFTPAATTIDGIVIPVGWTPAGETVSLTLGATTSEHHVLLAGKTGSGKSNLLHVLIHGLCEKYSPDEIDLYLLDYKESIEFNVYAQPPLPHARLIATESDPEYGLTVLRHLANEIKVRAEVFRNAGVSEFAAFRKLGRDVLPRSLLIIDEFQVLFAGKRDVAEQAEQLITELLKQGRAFGIHLLLATQTLKGINAQSIGGIISQLGCRLALACIPEDSAMILGLGNTAAAMLNSPPEGIINDAHGLASANVKFLIPYADSAVCRQHVSDLSKRAIIRGQARKARIFSGAGLPAQPPLPDYLRADDEPRRLLLGERLTFNADALVVPLTSRVAFNVLFSGFNDLIHDGLLASTLASIARDDDIDEVVYFNARGLPPGGRVDAVARTFGTRFRAENELASVPLQRILDEIGTRRIVLIIDGLDAEKALHPGSPFRHPKTGDPSTPADLLRQISEEGPRKGTFVFAFIDRWQRCASPCKDLLSSFELRVAYCMNEDDAGSLAAANGIGKFKGLDKPNRAAFINRLTSEIAWFRPYVDHASS